MAQRKLKYLPSTHAIERFREYFGTKEIHAVDFANDLMKSASFVVTQPDGRRIFKNDEYDTMVVLASKDNTIITVLPSQDKRKELTQPTEESPIVTIEVKPKVAGYNAIIEKAREVIVREIAKASRQFTKEYRELNIEQAELSVEIAQSTVKKFRCKAPHTQLIIQERIDALQRYHDVVQAKLQLVETEYESLTKEAEGYL